MPASVWSLGQGEDQDATSLQWHTCTSTSAASSVVEVLKEALDCFRMRDAGGMWHVSRYVSYSSLTKTRFRMMIKYTSSMQ